MTHARNSLRAALATTVAVYAIAVASPLCAQDKSFNVPAQDAVTGIPEFARQADVQILVSERMVKGKRTGAVSGTMSIEAALNQLIAGTGLKVASNDGRTFTLVPPGGDRVGELDGLPQRGSDAAAGSAGDRVSSSGDDSNSEGQAGISEILVVGSRTQNVDIRRTEDDSQPYVVFSGNEIRNSNPSNIEEFLRKRITANGSPNYQANALPGAPASVSEFRLRGFGPDQTLILVDGRRVPRTLFGGGTPTQGNINGIPISAIDRIEILPSSAGGIYGGGAVGGVINIVRKRDYGGVDVRLSHEGTFSGGAAGDRAELSAGFSPDHGRTQVSVAGSWYHAKPLYRDDNSLAADGRRLADANDPLGLPVVGYTTNIQSLTGNLTFRPEYGGGSLNSDHTFVPVGFTGLPPGDLNAARALAANAGRYNQALSADPNGTLNVARAGLEDWSANLNVRHSLLHNVAVFADASYMRTSTSSFNVPPSLYLLSPTDAGNPFNQFLLVYVPSPGAALKKLKSYASNIGLSAGAVIQLGNRWALSPEVSWSESRGESKSENTLNSSLLARDISNGSFNVFRDLNSANVDYSPYMLDGLEQKSGPFSNGQTVLAVRASGPMFRMSGGSAMFNGTIEHRNEEASPFQTVSFTSPSTPSRYTAYGKRTQRNNSAYVELTLPVFSAKNAISHVKELSVSGALRYDDYATSSAAPLTANGAAPTITNFSTESFDRLSYTGTLRFAPASGMIFRGSISTGFLPPNINQISPITMNQTFSFTIDPQRNERLGQSGPYQQISAGNPNLTPETSRSHSFGVIFEPVFFPGFRSSIDYTSIYKQNAISPSLAIDYLLNHESDFPGRVIRAAPLGGIPGRVLIIDTSAINIAAQRSRAIDLNVSYAISSEKTGNLSFYAAATHQLEFKTKQLPNSLWVRRDGFDVLKWRANGGVDWSIGRFRANWNAQYFDSYDVRIPDALTGFTSNQNVVRQGGNKVSSGLYNDVNASFSFGRGEGTLGKLELIVSIQNIFNKKGPIVAGDGLGYSPYIDPRLRRFTISIANHFGR